MQRGGPSIAQRLLIALLVGLAAIVAETQSSGRSVVRTLELQTLDWRFRLRGPLAPGPEIVLVTVDDATVAQLGAWPPPREVIGQAITG